MPRWVTATPFGRPVEPDDVGQVIRDRQCLRRRFRLGGDLVRRGVETDDLALAQTRQPRHLRPIADQQVDASVICHGDEACFGVPRVERQIGPTRLHDAQQRRDHRRRPLDAKTHQTLRTGAERPQMMRELVGPAIELRVAERRAIAALQRYRIRSSCRLKREQIGQRRRRDRARGIDPIDRLERFRMGLVRGSVGRTRRCRVVTQSTASSPTPSATDRIIGTESSSARVSGIEQFGAIFEVHRVEMRPAPAPDEAVALEDVHDLLRDAVAIRRVVPP